MKELKGKETKGEGEAFCWLPTPNKTSWDYSQWNDEQYPTTTNYYTELTIIFGIMYAWRCKDIDRYKDIKKIFLTLFFSFELKTFIK